MIRIFASKWTVHPALEFDGQGSKSISIRFKGPNAGTSLTATVQIKGLAPECASVVSETMTWEPWPNPVKIGVLYSLKSSEFETDLRRFIGEIRDNPNHQAVIFIGNRKGASSNEIDAREKVIIDELVKIRFPYDRSRITFVRINEGTEIVEFWRVPPGASNPKCESCEPSEKVETNRECPAISITGPADITMPGDTLKFKIAPRLNPAENLGFDWSVTEGTIEAGKGTQEITVRTDQHSTYRTVQARVAVSGFPTECKNSAEAQAVVTGIVDPIMLDEYGKLSMRDEKGRLDNFLNELLNNPTNIGYLIIVYKEGTSKAAIERRAKFVKDHVFGFRRFSKDRVVILSESGMYDLTRIYRFPRDASSPCPSCKVH